MMLTGATDMAQLRAKGVKAYGISEPVDEKDPSPHGNDERIAIDALGKYVEYIYRTVIDVDEHISAVRRQVGSRVLEAGEARVVTISRPYAAALDDVWDACTNSERIPRWLLPVSGELRLGGRYQLEGNAGGVVERCDPPRSFAATWEYGGDVSWIELRLDPDGDGTRFTLEHIAHVDDARWAEFGPGAAQHARRHPVGHHRLHARARGRDPGHGLGRSALRPAAVVPPLARALHRRLGALWLALAARHDLVGWTLPRARNRPTECEPGTYKAEERGSLNDGQEIVHLHHQFVGELVEIFAPATIKEDP